METQKQVDLHKFGVGDYCSADDYAENEIVKAKVLTFLGRQQYIARDGTPKSAGMYKVEAQGIGVPQQFRLGIKNEKLAAKRYGMKNYEDLVGKLLTLKVKKFQLGQGFVLMDISK